MNSHIIKNVADPLSNQDVTTKKDRDPDRRLAARYEVRAP